MRSTGWCADRLTTTATWRRRHHLLLTTWCSRSSPTATVHLHSSHSASARHPPLHHHHQQQQLSSNKVLRLLVDWHSGSTIQHMLLYVEPSYYWDGWPSSGGYSTPPRYVTKPTKSTQPCTPPGSLNQVPASSGWDKGGNVTSARWQVTLSDPLWHMSSCSGEVCCKLLYPVDLLYYTSLSWCQQSRTTPFLMLNCPTALYTKLPTLSVINRWRSSVDCWLH